MDLRTVGSTGSVDSADNTEGSRTPTDSSVYSPVDSSSPHPLTFGLSPCPWTPGTFGETSSPENVRLGGSQGPSAQQSPYSAWSDQEEKRKLNDARDSEQYNMKPLYDNLCQIAMSQTAKTTVDTFRAQAEDLPHPASFLPKERAFGAYGAVSHDYEAPLHSFAANRERVESQNTTFNRQTSHDKHLEYRSAVPGHMYHPTQGFAAAPREGGFPQHYPASLSSVYPTKPSSRRDLEEMQFKLSDNVAAFPVDSTALPSDLSRSLYSVTPFTQFYSSNSDNKILDSQSSYKPKDNERISGFVENPQGLACPDLSVASSLMSSKCGESATDDLKDDQVATEEARELCQICTDVSAGFHCGAYVCEACKKFFVRAVKSDDVKFTCSNDNNCTVTKETRTHCQACRYNKCLKLGMYKPGGQNVSQVINAMPCAVCNGPSSGFHFGAITCEGCKGFFRRMSKEKDLDRYVCRYGGNCDITSKARGSCKDCRYKKCLVAGLSLSNSRIGRQSNLVKHATLLQIQEIQSQRGEGTPDVFTTPATKRKYIRSKSSSSVSDKRSENVQPQTCGKDQGDSMRAENWTRSTSCLNDEAVISDRRSDKSSGSSANMDMDTSSHVGRQSSQDSNFERHASFSSSCYESNENSKMSDENMQDVQSLASRDPYISSFTTEQFSRLSTSESPVTTPPLHRHKFQSTPIQPLNSHPLLHHPPNSRPPPLHPINNQPPPIRPISSQLPPIHPIKSQPPPLHPINSQPPPIHPTSSQPPPLHPINSQSPPPIHPISSHPRMMGFSASESSMVEYPDKTLVAERKTDSTVIDPGVLGSVTAEKNIQTDSTVTHEAPSNVRTEASAANSAKDVHTSCQEDSSPTEASKPIVRSSRDTKCLLISPGIISAFRSNTGLTTVKSPKLSSNMVIEMLKKTEIEDLKPQTVVEILRVASLDLSPILQKSPLTVYITKDVHKKESWKSQMHQFTQCAMATIKFAKKIPGFRKLPMDDQIFRLQSTLYPIVLSVLATKYDIHDCIYCYFNFDKDEESEIHRLFPAFILLKDTLHNTGFSLKSIDADMVEVAILSALLLMIDVTEVEDLLLDSLNIYCQCRPWLNENRFGLILLRLGELVRAKGVHHKSVVETSIELLQEGFDIPQLFQESFLID